MDVENEQKGSMDTIRKNNKKHVIFFLLYLVLGGLAGAGLSRLFLWKQQDINRLHSTLSGFLSQYETVISWILPLLMIAIIAVLMIAELITVGQGKKQYLQQAQMDEDHLQRIESKLSNGLWISSAVNILLFFLYSTEVLLFSRQSGAASETGAKAPGLDVAVSSLLAASAVIIVGLIIVTIVQQKVVDVIRLINPEKRGSVYDIKFHKKWEESCDEREKMAIYKSAYRAYQATTQLCLGLWTVFTIVNLMTGEGYGISVTALLVWFFMMSVYTWHSTRDTK